MRLRNMSRANTIKTLQEGGIVTYHQIYSVYRVYDKNEKCIGSLLYTTFFKLLNDGIMAKQKSDGYSGIEQYKITTPA